MIQYPLSFYGEAHANMGLATSWEAQVSELKTTCAVPKEFEGEGNGASPEDLYLMALQNCFVATFKVYAHYSKLEFQQLGIKSELIVDLDETKKPCMKTAIFHIWLQGAKDKNRAQSLVKKAIASGFILNSVKTEIRHELSFAD